MSDHLALGREQTNRVEVIGWFANSFSNSGLYERNGKVNLDWEGWDRGFDKADGG